MIERRELGDIQSSISLPLLNLARESPCIRIPAAEAIVEYSACSRCLGLRRIVHIMLRNTTFDFHRLSMNGGLAGFTVCEDELGGFLPAIIVTEFLCSH